jgi:hypothetical protein
MVALGVLLTGLLAGLSMQSDGVDILGDTSVGGLLLSSGGGGVAVALILAAGTAMVVRRRSVLAGLSIAAAVVIGGSALLFSSDFAEVMAGGVLLGCSAVQANSTRVRQALLTTSFLLGLLSVGAVEALQHSAIPRRYADYLTESDLGTPVVVPVLCVLVVVAVAWAARAEQGESPATDRDIRTVAAVLLVAIGGLLLNMVFVFSMFQSLYGFGGRWYLGLLVVPVLFAAAGLLPGRSGVMVLAGTAVLLTSTTTAGLGISASDRGWVLGMVALTAVSVAAGTALGFRWGRPLIGVAVLAVVCVTALFNQPPLDNVHYAATLIVFPAAAAYLYVACTPAAPTPSTLGLAIPAAITVPMVVTYGWTSYTPLTSALTDTSWPRVELWLSTGGACVAVVFAGVGMWALNRYRTLL